MDSASELLAARAKVVAVAGAVLGLAATFAVQGLVFRPNRIAPGEASALIDALGAWGVALATVWVCAGGLALSPLPQRWRGGAVTLLGGLAAVVCLLGSGLAATAYAEVAGDIARTSLGWGVWLNLFAAYTVVFAATAWLRPGLLRAALAYLPIVAVVVLAVNSVFSQLGVAREYANNAESFWREFNLHLAYVAGATAVGLGAGLALGLLAAKRPRTEPVIFGSLNVLQVLPTLAFVGLLNPLLSGLAARIDLLDSMGVRGVGWAPVLIVLSSYAVYPIARNTHAAVVSLDREIVDAARGVGMSRLQVLARVELPLSLPVIVAGLRVALVQSTAGAIIAGLVGGGGLGLFVFLGASETAGDLILLGVLPIAALAILFDRVALAAQQAFGYGGTVE